MSVTKAAVNIRYWNGVWHDMRENKLSCLLWRTSFFMIFSLFRNQKKESDLANALAQWRKVEATLSYKDAECTKLLSENSRLKDDFTDLQGQLENV